MKHDESRHLIGGYASGNLTPEERKTLFEAALQDQELFDALAGEQTLKEALDDPAVRRELIAELTPAAPTWRERWAARLRPAFSFAAVGVVAAATIAVAIVVRNAGPKAQSEIAQTLPRPERPAETAAPLAPAAPLISAKPRSESIRSPKSKAFVPPPVFESADSAEPSSAAAKRVESAATPIPAPTSLAPMPAAAVEQAELRKSAVAGNATEEQRAAQARDRAAPGFVGGVPGGVVGGVVSASPRAAPFTQRSEDVSSSDAASAKLPQPGITYRAQKLGESVSLVLDAAADSIVYLFRQTEDHEWIPVTPGGISVQAHLPVSTPAFKVAALQPPAVLVLSRRPQPILAQTGPALTRVVRGLLANTPTDVSVVAIKLP